LKTRQILNNMDMYFGIVFLYVLILLVVLDVSIRFLSLQPFIGTIEVVRICLIWSVFIALRYTTKEGGHIRMGELLARFPEKVQHVVRLIWQASAVMVFGIISISSIISIIRNFYSTTEALNIPYWIFFLPTIVGFTLVTLQYLVILIRYIKNHKTL
jgi:TRAP-type C4-dicarboxylate transport system permease small subunit